MVAYYYSTSMDKKLVKMDCMLSEIACLFSQTFLWEGRKGLAFFAWNYFSTGENYNIQKRQTVNKYYNKTEHSFHH